MRQLNWLGASIESIAAVYETNAAAEEVEEIDRLGGNGWAWLNAAWAAEWRGMLLDEKEGVR
jgi:hypothetical protein